MVNEEDDKKAAVPNGRSNRSKVFLFLVFLLVVYKYTGGFKHQMTEEEEDRMLIEQAKGKTKKRSTDESGEDLKKNVKMLKADSRLGFWSVHAPPLVQKRPTRECSIKRIAPQVTDPITYFQKKKRVQRRAYSCLFPGGACDSVDYILQDFQDRRWKKVKGKTRKDVGIRTWDATFVITNADSLQKLQASSPDSYDALYYEREGATYLNVIDGTSPLTGKLTEQFLARKRYVTGFGCHYNSLKLQMAQFDTHDPEDCKAMKTFLSKAPASSVFSVTTEKGGKVFSPKSMKAKELESNDYCEKSASRNIILQMVDKPLLLSKRAFDVRSYMLIGSAMPFMVFFRRGYIRKSTVDFKGTRPKPHEFDEGNEAVTLNDFQTHFAHAKTIGNHYVETLLGSAMKHIALFVFHSARRTMVRRRGSYQLLSIDYYVDENFHVYLEKTTSDVGPSSKFDVGGMIAEMHDLVQELHEVPVAFQGMTKGDKYGGWELLFSELQESCNKIAYNPCHAFIDFNSRNLKKANSKVGKVHNTANRERHENDRIKKKSEEQKRQMCKDKGLHYPGQKCEKLDKALQDEKFNTLFELHEKEYNPNSFRMPRPGEVFPWEKV